MGDDHHWGVVLGADQVLAFVGVLVVDFLETGGGGADGRAYLTFFRLCAIMFTGLVHSHKG